MLTLDRFELHTVDLPQRLDERVPTDVLVFAWADTQPAPGVLPDWDPERIGLGWTADGLVLTGATEEPILFPLPGGLDVRLSPKLDNDIPQPLSRGELFDSIEGGWGLSLCVMGEPGQALATVRFSLLQSDPQQVHLVPEGLLVD